MNSFDDLCDELRVLSTHYKSSAILDIKLYTEFHGIHIHTQDFEAPLFFTFDFMDTANQKTPLKNKKGWGFEFLKRQGFNVCSFITHDIYTWYRHPEFIRIIDFLSKSQPFINFENKIVYGSSMGGYAASAYSKALGASKAILMNPISSLNMDLVPFETRFEKPKKENNWKNKYHDGAKEVANIPTYIVYDPLFSLDNAHVTRYKLLCNSATHEIKVPGVGHGIPWHIQALDVYKPLFLSIIDNNFQSFSNEFYKKIRKRKKYNGYFRFMLSKHNRHLTPNREKIILLAYIQYLFTEHQNLGKILDALKDVNLRFHEEMPKLLLEEIVAPRKKI